MVLGPGRDEHGAAPAQQTMQHPTVGAFAVAHAAPILRLGDHLDGKAGAVEHPNNGLVGTWSFADIHLVGFQTDEARQSEPAGAGLFGLGHLVIGRSDRPHDQQRHKRRHHHEKSMWNQVTQPRCRISGQIRPGDSPLSCMRQKSERIVASRQ